ncbi:MAG: hypothetical protein E6J90_08470 [Deltaproteobacteria bacterium]|nr:MAG: hypothetical protein E6J90_08470 [Deltaproteobacteria bacterium]
MSLVSLDGARRHPRLAIWLIALALGAALFFGWIGYARTLDPRNVSWISHEDPATHLIGWEQYRNAPLVQYPITKNGLYGLELSSNVVFSDSIPIAAIALRPLSDLLPQPFQYLGWWVLLSCVLQAYWAVRLVLLRTDRVRDAVLGSLLFITTPVLLERFGGQTAVGSHWLVLWALWLYLNGRGVQLRAWAVLLVLTVSIHAYLFAMVGPIWAAHLVACWRQRQLGRREVALAAATVLGVVAWMHVLGYFMIGKGAAAAAWRSNCDLLAFLAPAAGARQRWLPVIYNDPWDGCMYLGAGAIALLVGSAAAWLVAGRRRASPEPEPPRPSRPPWTPLVIVVIGLALFAITNDVKLLGHHVVNLPFPRTLDRLYEMFRGAARLMWPAYYLVLLSAVWLAIRAWPARAVTWVIAAAVLLQLYDVTPETRIKRTELAAPGVLREPTDPVWTVLGEHYARIVSVPTHNRQPDWPLFAWFAARHRMGTNIGYLSRVDPVAEAAVARAHIHAIGTGTYDPDTVYYVPGAEVWNIARATMGPEDVALIADGFRLIVPGGRRWMAQPPLPPLAPLWTDQWLTFNQPDHTGLLFSGWSWWESWGTWSIGPRSRITLPAPANQRVRVSFRWFSPFSRRRARVQIAGQRFDVAFPIRDQEVSSSFEVDATTPLLDVEIDVAGVVVRPDNQRTVGIGLVAARVQLASEPVQDLSP